MTVSEQIIQVLDVLCEKFGVAINWTSENIIPYIEVLCKKLITYEIYMSVATLIMNLLIIIICVFATKKLYPFFKNGIEQADLYDEDGWWIGATLAGCVVVILALTAITVSVCQVGDIIKCVTFPEMYIFEYISSLINGV